MSILKNVLQVAIPIRNVSKTFTRLNSFSSAISLKHLYPNSSLRLSHISQPPNNGKEFNGYIPLDQLEITYSRSSGPGGQNVNRVNTKVDVRFHLESATWLSDNIRKKLSEKCMNKLTKEGNLVFRSDLTRHQQLNLADCLEKIRALIRNSCKEDAQPSEETLDRIRKRHERAAKARLSIKRERSQVKSDRSANIII